MSCKTKRKPTVMIVAGEASGDLHGSNLVRSIKRMSPDTSFLGVGGKKMQDAGVHIITASSNVAVVGFTEVLARIDSILKTYIKLKNILKSGQVDLLVLIDFPDFNLHVAKIARHLGIPIFYYISPQVWAWRKNRAEKIAGLVDRIAVILPFERDFYKRRRIKVDYVGHPLLDVCPDDIDRNEEKNKFGIKENCCIVGMLPGSRKEEVTRLLPVMIDAAEILNRRFSSVKYLLPLAHTIEKNLVQHLIEKSKADITVISGDKIHQLLSICDAAVVTSGTATLEVAIMGTPMIVVYMGSPVSFWIAKRLVKVPYISLVNLVAGKKVVPELIQEDVTPYNIASELTSLIEDKSRNNTIRRSLMNLKNSLGGKGASERAAKIAIELLSKPT
ncbi:MAG: lipid-A-disaccharide synthase [Deltaproteobacteria bacterium]|nr:lipid-A-disaccharide synthase [Deltaproteobacteria bacterium]